MSNPKEVRENLRKRGLNSKTVKIVKSGKIYQLEGNNQVLAGNFTSRRDAQIGKRRYLRGLPVFKKGKVIK